MAKIILNPQSGTPQSSKSIFFSLEGIDVDTYRVRVENTTCKVAALIKNYIQSGRNCSGELDIRIGEKTTESAFSLFFIIEVPTQDGSKWKIHDIYPSIFNLIEQKVSFNGSLNVSPLFIGPSDIGSINIKIEKSEKIIFSINNKKLTIYTDNNGEGSVHFSGKDIFLNHFKNDVNKYPLYYYLSDDNYVSKRFSGIYITALPQTISMHASVDPRCDPNDPAYVATGTWSQPTECPTDGPDPIEPDVDGPDVGEPTKPPIDIPSSCKESSNILDTSEICHIHNHSIALLDNGQVAHAYTYVDKSITDPTNVRYNKNRVVVTISNSSVDVQVIAIQDISIASKVAGGQFHLYVTEDLFNLLAAIDDVSGSDIVVTLYDKTIGYNKIRIIERTIDEYTASYVLIGEMDNDNLEIKGWLFCTPAVFYYDDRSIALNNNDQWIIPDVVDSEGNILQVLNISIASNNYYIGEKEEIYVYLVAEAFVNNHSQLFFYTHSVYKNDNRYLNQTPTHTFEYPWKQLTSDENNSNPKCIMDKTNTLHIFWESDRTGKKQIYYGVLGSLMKMNGCMAVSSIVDKYAEFYEKDDKAFSYINAQMIQPVHNGVPEYAMSTLVENHWELRGREPLSIVEVQAGSNYLKDLYISVYGVMDQESMAFSRLPIFSTLDNPSSAIESAYLQFNYQVSFDFSTTITQPSSLMEDWNGSALADHEIETVYKSWQETFQLTVEEDIHGRPVYIKDGERFTLGRQDHIYDRVVPFFGSYAGDDVFDNPSNTFQIKILKDNSNLKDYVFGLFLEKSYFKAINLETGAEENHKIYTGRAKFVTLIKTEDTTERANYFIVREFPEAIDITQSVKLGFLVGYTKISSDEVVNALDQYNGEYTSRYAGTLVFFIDDLPKFSHGFISKLYYSSYNYFDLGFGVPAGGYYISDKMLLSKLTVFDDLEIELAFKNVNISSPTYTYNSTIMNLPDTTKDWSKLKVLAENIDDPSNATLEDTSIDLYNLGFRGEEEIRFEDTVTSNIHNGFSQYKIIDLNRVTLSFTPSVSTTELSRLVVWVVGGAALYDSGYISSSDWAILDIGNMDFDVSNYNSIIVQVFCDDLINTAHCHIYFKKVYNQNTFLQIPLTFEGISQSVNIDLGICNDVHAVWESNRDRYWNIYTANSADKLRPFRFNTQITDTTSNSLMPDIAVSNNGRRMIVWQDDRDGKYNIYSARSIENYECSEDTCKNKMVEPVLDYISECTLTENYVTTLGGTYHFRFDLYNDNALTDLYATISSVNSQEGWHVNNVALGENGAILLNGQRIDVLYVPSNKDKIFDKVLYSKLTVIEV